MGIFQNGVWLGIATPLLLTASVYFVLSFIESLRQGDERIAKQSKIVAVISFGVALLLPSLYQLFT